jgi:hypothetical protein
MSRHTLLFFLLLGLSVSGFAQLPFEVHAGGGLTFPTGDMGGNFNTGAHFVLGGGPNIAPFVRLQAEYMYNHVGMNSSFANSFGAGGGSAHVNSLTIDPVVHGHLPGTRWGLFGTGGIGYYRRTEVFTNPAFSLHNGAFGYNIGGGVTKDITGPLNLYFEVKYHRAVTGRGDTQLVPVTVGLTF